MAWYLVTIKHGPGHQSIHKDYVWAVSQGDVEYAVNDICKRRQTDWPIADRQVIRCLPKDVKERLVYKYRAERDHAQAMLRILAQTKTKD